MARMVSADPGVREHQLLAAGDIVCRFRTLWR
jgi:hypothetical protein